jgi:hypothetical protein
MENFYEANDIKYSNAKESVLRVKMLASVYVLQCFWHLYFGSRWEGEGGFQARSSKNLQSKFEVLRMFNSLKTLVAQLHQDIENILDHIRTTSTKPTQNHQKKSLF